jgi:hypothetical protein
MRWVEITDTTGRVVWINDNYFQAKDSAEDLVQMLRPPV